MTKSGTTIAFAMLIGIASANSRTSGPVQVTVNGRSVEFNAAQPQMSNGHVLVPLRGVFEQLGAQVLWNAKTQSIQADGGGHSVRLSIGSYDASVNGQAVSLDTTPALVNGSTMVPLRFLSQALGAKVDWQPQNNLVAITSSGAVVPTNPVTNGITRGKKGFQNGGSRSGSSTQAPYLVNRSTVIPLILDQTLSSNGSRSGDTFTATVKDEGGAYLDFPNGTVIEGTVNNASAAKDNQGGALEVRFNQIRFPNGSRYQVTGTIARMDDKSITKTDNGRFVASNTKSNSLIPGAEIGAGAGLLIGSLKGKAVGGALVGGILGSLVGSLDKQRAKDVTLPAGTKLGLILRKDLSIDRNDIRP